MPDIMKNFRDLIKRITESYYLLLYIIFYPQKMDLYKYSPTIIKGYILQQKIFNINGCRNIAWPVHYTSKVTGKVSAGRISAPGMSPGCYIQGINGIIVGDNVFIGPGVKIISANHDLTNLKNHIETNPIKIGNNVWIGANAVILPGRTIGDNAIIGAGSIVTKDVESSCVVAGNPATIIAVVNSGSGS